MVSRESDDRFQDDGAQDQDFEPKQIFAVKMRDRMLVITEAISVYITAVDVHVVADVEDLEKTLRALFDAYLAAKTVVDTALDEVERVTGNRNAVCGNWSANRPKLLMVGTLKEIAETKAAIAQFDVEAERVREVARRAREARATIEQEIFKIMPKYVWIEHGDLHFGIDTDTWGGYAVNLHVRKPGQELFKLGHRTDYN